MSATLDKHMYKNAGEDHLHTSTDTKLSDATERPTVAEGMEGPYPGGWIPGLFRTTHGHTLLSIHRRTFANAREELKDVREKMKEWNRLMRARAGAGAYMIPS